MCELWRNMQPEVDWPSELAIGCERTHDVFDSLFVDDNSNYREVAKRWITDNVKPELQDQN